MTASNRYTAVPDSQLAKEVTELIRDTESELLFNHSTQVYLWGALTGQRRGLTFDSELLYVGAMFMILALPSVTASRSYASRSMAPMPREPSYDGL